MPDNREDISKIVQFLGEAKIVIADAISRKDELFITELHDPIVRSWENVEARINRLIEKLGDGHFLAEASFFDSPCQRDRHGYRLNLEDVGLAGDELNLKLAGFGEVYQIWKRVKENELWQKMPWKKVLKNLFEWINIVLSSLSVLSFIADPIREFKDALEAGIGSKETFDEIRGVK